MIKWEINPEWLTATHMRILTSEMRSLVEIIRADRNAQAKALKSLPKSERKKYMPIKRK